MAEAMVDRAPGPPQRRLNRNADYDPDLEDESAEPTLLERFDAVTRKPTSPLAQILRLVVLFLLVLSVVFMSLFIEQHLELKRRERDGSQPPPKVTVTSTSVVTTTVLPPSHPTSPPSEQTCLTPECIILSTSI
ncbi:hypothetical protein R3P38DRAFT_2955002 [Favolaschia claudopus]|uniref:Uncharacterized protein n=1 Tax=Favolaschia claudopus TaxID=2862362 RepID=A0AAW0BCQ3_9AGAR